jgi:hypothetical protein
VHKAPNINTNSSPLGILCSFFLEIMHLLVEETHNGWTCLMNDTAHCFMWLHEMYLFLIIVLQMRHDQRHRLKTLLVQARTLSSWPLMETQWNETDSSTYRDFYILVTTRMNLIRQTNIMNGCGK